MRKQEIIHITIAIIVLAIVIGFIPLIELNFARFAIGILFALIIISTNIFAKKLVAMKLDADIEHEIWAWSRYGFKPGWHLKNAIPAGVIIPLFFTAFTFGAVKMMTLLTYETSALKRRAAKKFGTYSFTEMTDFHNALIGAAGIFATLLISFVSYWIPGLEGLPQAAAFYAFWNIIPFFKFDGAQIYFGSRVIWTALALIAAIFAGFALIIV